MLAASRLLNGRVSSDPSSEGKKRDFFFFIFEVFGSDLGRTDDGFGLFSCSGSRVIIACGVKQLPSEMALSGDSFGIVVGSA